MTDTTVNKNIPLLGGAGNNNIGQDLANIREAFVAIDAFIKNIEVKAELEVVTPVNLFPAAAAVNILDAEVFQAGEFFSNYSASHSTTQVQINTLNNFEGAITFDSGPRSGINSLQMTKGILAISTNYYWRIRYQNSRGSWSDWSAPTGFTTAAVFDHAIPVPTPTPAAFGDALDGGYYAGTEWNELMQASNSFLISVGEKTFTVPDMSVTKKVYIGQQLEVRSRSNPNNKMTATVTAALGTSLKLNVSAVNGAGTFADWSIMAKYRLIVAPKSNGQASLALKNSNTALPTGSTSPVEGYKNTLAMIAAGDATVYPAAHFCYGLNIAGHTDWYIPARNELELCYRNLKPTTQANVLTNSVVPAAASSFGCYADGVLSSGVNLNSTPQGTAYTAGFPIQVAAGKNFRSNESEAFSDNYYVASTDNSALYATYMSFRNDNSSGTVSGITKTTQAAAAITRAVRRSII
jgi:hypothetical protein